MFRWLANIFSGRPKAAKFVADVPAERGLSPERKTTGPIDSTTPPVPFQVIPEIEKLVLSTPDFSQAVERTIAFANTGHQVAFEGLSDKESAAAREELENFAARAFKPAAGLDSLVNALLRQITIAGALSAEAVPEDDFSGIRKVVLVPVRQVRFKRNDRNDWVPYQEGGAEQIDLNENQYMYIPLQRNEESPYGIPPFSAALEMAGSQKSAFGRIVDVIDKFGLLGFIHAKKKAPQNYGLSDREYKEKLTKDLEAFADGFRKNFKTGVAVSYDDTSIDHRSITGDARGAADLFQVGEEQLASGIDMDPALLGRSYSTTETYAGVVYQAFLSKLAGRTRIVKRFLERVYFLHLVLAGYRVKKVRVTFNPARSLNPQSDAQAENFRLLNIKMKEDAGWIDADQAAKEAGYEKATGTKAAASAGLKKKKNGIIQNANTRTAEGANLIRFPRAH